MEQHNATPEELTTEEKRENINARIDELRSLIDTAVEHGYHKQANNLISQQTECYNLLDELEENEGTPLN